MNTHYLRKILYVFLQIARAVLFVSLILIPAGTVLDKRKFSFIVVVNIIVTFVYFFDYFNVSRHLLRIIKSCGETPFTKENVRSFNIMGVCLFINSIFECIMGYNAGRNSSIQIFGSQSGAITPGMVICIVASLMCFVIGEAFDKAVKIKEENDLTI